MIYREHFDSDGTNLAGVDSQTVILVLHNGIADGDPAAVADIKSISVVATIAIAVGVVDGDMIQHQVVSLDTEGLHRGVLDIEAGDARVIQAVRVEELGLGLAAVCALGVPPPRSVAVNDVAGFARHLDVLSGHPDQRALPFFVPEGGLALENDLWVIRETSDKPSCLVVVVP